MSFQTKFAKFTFGTGSRIRVYRQMERLSKNNIPLPSILDTLWMRASAEGTKPTNSLAIILDSWRNAVRSGKMLSAGMADWVPSSERMLIEAGESGGQLSQALQDVVKIALGTKRVRGAIIGGLAYPCVLLVAVFLTFYGFGKFIIPSFEQLKPKSQWTGSAAGVAAVSDFVGNWTSVIAGVFVSLFVLYIYSAPRWTGKTRTWFDKFPPWSMYRMGQGLSFLLATSALVQAKMPMTNILDRLLLEANPYTAERIELARTHYRDGIDLGLALKQTKTGFPNPEIIEELRVYAPLKGFEDALRQIAEDWLDLSVKKVEGQAKVLNTVLLVLFAGVIMWMGSGFFSVQQQVVNQAQGIN